MSTQSFGIYYQCYKNPYATYIGLSSIRKHYPSCTIVLLSDNGYNYSEMAKIFDCIYIHEYENLWLTYKEFETGGHIINSCKLIDRVSKAFKLCKEEYVMWFEDDVSINKPIADIFKYDINGYNPNNVQSFSLPELKKKYNFIDMNKRYSITGHGGSVYHKTNTLKAFENKEIINDILINWNNYKFPSDIGHDFMFSVIVILSEGTIGSYDGHNDWFYGINPNLCVQHQFKMYYNIPLPNELKYLITE